MPQLGETVAEGKIAKWFKQAGDAVKPGDNLFEIETDKTSMEVPATSAGADRDPLRKWRSRARSAPWSRSSRARATAAQARAAQARAAP